MEASTSSNYPKPVKVEAITKCTIGKLLVKHCGNEGQPDDKTLAVPLRKLLQAAITMIGTESAETWRNSEMVIYDQLGHEYCIQSGKAENKFIVQLDGKDNITTTCAQRETKMFKALPNLSSITGTIRSIPSQISQWMRQPLAIGYETADQTMDMNTETDVA